MTPLKPASAVILLATLLLAGCAELVRGEVTPSEDGHAYFAVFEYGGGDCDAVTLDGMPWPHPKGQFAKIAPGTHTIADCSPARGDLSGRALRQARFADD